MSEDKEVLRDIWEGKVPICFTLSPDEIVLGSDQPLAQYMIVSRNTYFPLVLDKVQRYFTQFTSAAKTNEMWLDDAGQPIKWHYPVGVLFDIAAVQSLPWILTVHFEKFPEGEILHCTSKDVVEAHFMSVLKEADCFKHRGEIVNNMMKKDHKQLWLGLVNDKFDQFWAINRKFMEHNSEDLFRSIPFKIYVDDKPCIQKLFSPKSDDGALQTLENLLQLCVPEALQDRTRYRIVIHGLEVPLHTPVQWLSEHLSHPDNMLHIVVQHAELGGW